MVIPPGSPPDFVHGKDGLENTNQAESGLRAQSVSAAEFIVASINKYPDEITALPIGRVSNLENALALDPGVTAEVKDVVLMGLV